jgi:hypothetical protein
MDSNGGNPQVKLHFLPVQRSLHTAFAGVSGSPNAMLRLVVSSVSGP